MQSRARGVAAAAANDADERRHIDDVIGNVAWPMFTQQIAAMGVIGHGWVKPRMAGNYGDDWLMRTVANFTGIWANTQNEVIYFANGNVPPLNGRDFYTATFTKNDLPDAHVQ